MNETKRDEYLAAKNRQKIRDERRRLARQKARDSNDETLQRALYLAEAGYGIQDVVIMSGVPLREAKDLVLGDAYG